VVYVEAIGLDQAPAAFKRLEAVVPLKGNKFFATYDQTRKAYRACARIADPAKFAAYGLPRATLAGGTYATTELVGPLADIVPRIAPAFEALIARHGFDRSRLPIEFYKRQTQVVLYLPVAVYTN